MAKMQFWGTLRGRGDKPVERGGTKDTGLEVQAAGWNGRIIVRVYYDRALDRDMFRVLMTDHWNGSTEMKEIASGVLDKDALKDPYIPALIA